MACPLDRVDHLTMTKCANYQDHNYRRVRSRLREVLLRPPSMNLNYQLVASGKHSEVEKYRKLSSTLHVMIDTAWDHRLIHDRDRQVTAEYTGLVVVLRLWFYSFPSLSHATSWDGRVDFKNTWCCPMVKWERIFLHLVLRKWCVCLLEGCCLEDIEDVLTWCLRSGCWKIYYFVRLPLKLCLDGEYW